MRLKRKVANLKMNYQHIGLDLRRFFLKFGNMKLSIKIIQNDTSFPRINHLGDSG